MLSILLPSRTEKQPGKPKSLLQFFAKMLGMACQQNAQPGDGWGNLSKSSYIATASRYRFMTIFRAVIPLASYLLFPFAKRFHFLSVSSGTRLQERFEPSASEMRPFGGLSLFNRCIPFVLGC